MNRLLRLRDIIGDRKAGIPAIIPISKASWYKGMQDGLYPRPLKLTERTALWRESDIMQLIENAGPEKREVNHG